jgi:uncharacterized protein
VILGAIAANAVIREPASGTTSDAPDPGDQHLWDLIASMPEAVLVTGDRALLEHPPDSASVVAPRPVLGWIDR